MNKTGNVTHRDPIWRERSDFVIGMALEDDLGREQLFARQLGPYRFEICCIPFMTYGLSLSDVVVTDDGYQVTEIVERSGRRTFRVWFGESFQPREEIAQDLARLGALLEWSSTNLLAVDAADASLAESIVAYLEERRQQGHLLWEDGE